MRKIKFINIFAGLVLILYPFIFGVASVYAVPELPGTPDQPEVTTSPDSPDTPDGPILPGEEEPVGTNAVPSSSSVSEPSYSENSSEPEATSSNSDTGANSSNDAGTTTNNDTDVAIDNDADIDNLVGVDSISGGNDADKNTGNGSVDSGDTSIVGSVESNANSINVGTLECANECDVVSLGSLESSNSNTGADSDNSANSQLNSDNNLDLGNFADIDNFVLLDADSGYNSASRNTGDGTVVAGDSEVIFTGINTANNVNIGLDVFNVYDDQTGDIIINYDDIAANILGGSLGSANTSTGTDSDNIANSELNNSNTILVDNQGNLVNNYLIDANTGDNTADKNTGDGSITTGDANVVFNLINFFNNVFFGGGELLLGMVNIFGTLDGDIVLQGLDGGSGGPYASSLSAANSQTGFDSNNNADSSVNNDTDIDLSNNAEILNNITLDANTGDNTADKNTGSGIINTGDTNANLNVANIANTSSIGGDGETIWMVLVNNLGEWTGQLFNGIGSDSGVYSPFFTFNINPDGSFSAENNTTGAESDNTATASVNNDTDIDITNNGNIVNNVTIDANTGQNSASYNTGSGSINTGDANVAANIVNVLNNTFLGGRFAITIVNIFGSFLGDIREDSIGSNSITVGDNDSVAISPNETSRSYSSSPNSVNAATVPSGIGTAGYGTASNGSAAGGAGSEDKDNIVLVAGESDTNDFSPIARFNANRGLFDGFRLEFLLIPIIFGILISLTRRVIVRR